MHYRFLIIALLSLLTIAVGKAEGEREQIIEGIATVEHMVEARQWHEAFQKLRALESSTAKTDALRYLTTKQRYTMYDRLHKASETKDCMDRLELLAKRSGDQATIEDMLITKADYNYKNGNTQTANECYIQVFENRAQGKDDAGRGQCYQAMIAEARNTGAKGMELVISNLYQAWQDSISAVRAAEEIVQLKEDCANAQDEITEKQSTITRQYTIIVILSLVIICAVVGLGILLLMLMRGRSVNRKLRKNLEVSETNSEQKSLFIRNIGQQISPSLQQIASGNAQQHVNALQAMLSDVERFLAIEEDKDTRYEYTNCDVSKLCEELCANYSESKVNVTTDTTRLQFPVCVDTMKQVLTNLISEASAQADTERIVLSFKKRNPHTGQFVVTATGMKLEDEDKASLFVPFARVYDLSVSTGLVLPICALLTHKMNGEISIDETFSKGVKFVVEIHS